MMDLEGIKVLSGSRCPECEEYRAEIRRLQRIIQGLTGRIAGQSEVIAKFAERPRVDEMVTFPSEKHATPHPEVPE
jgi:hypothetical protein